MDTLTKYVLGVGLMAVGVFALVVSAENLDRWLVNIETEEADKCEPGLTYKKIHYTEYIDYYEKYEIQDAVGMESYSYLHLYYWETCGLSDGGRD
ncbi:MAG: hypothetical protein J4F28_02205 [Nitrosopumilaceae archaeon]|nr:hypothetical protein [Nitrosopumilaceae archaeon]